MEKETISYVFTFDDNRIKKYSLDFDAKSMSLLPQENAKNYPWTKLECGKCSHCSLDEKDNSECPVAVNIACVVDEFKDDVSTKDVKVEVITTNRTYVKETALQNGIFGLVGLVMATCGCPHMDFLRYMARFHLPFATVKETMVRSLSTFLIKEYVNANKSGTEFRANIEKLDEHYHNVTTVNEGIIKRIRTISKGDADLNAMVKLDTFASMLTYEIEDDMEELEEMFE